MLSCLFTFLFTKYSLKASAIGTLLSALESGEEAWLCSQGATDTKEATIVQHEMSRKHVLENFWNFTWVCHLIFPHWKAQALIIPIWGRVSWCQRVNEPLWGENRLIPEPEFLTVNQNRSDEGEPIVQWESWWRKESFGGRQGKHHRVVIWVIQWTVSSSLGRQASSSFQVKVRANAKSHKCEGPGHTQGTPREPPEFCVLEQRDGMWSKAEE